MVNNSSNKRRRFFRARWTIVRTTIVLVCSPNMLTLLDGANEQHLRTSKEWAKIAKIVSAGIVDQRKWGIRGTQDSLNVRRPSLRIGNDMVY